MTDKLPPLSTQTVAPSQSALPAPGATTPQGATKQEAVEEEPYTIKCICDFSEDDGNTIYCETCDTWQHIECFYPNGGDDVIRDDFSHSCAECKPRPLDRQEARQRQSARLMMPAQKEEPADKKAKRPPTTKSHKKKLKPTDLQLNGQSLGQSSSHEQSKKSTSHEHPPAKRSKNSHKSSHSISSQAPKRSPQLATNGKLNNHGHPPSPVATPPDLPNSKPFYSLSLEDKIPHNIVRTNSFVRLEISNTMSVWLRDPDRMRRETGLEFSDVYQKLPKNIDSLKRQPRAEFKQITLPDRVFKLPYFVAPSATEKEVPLMEVNGQIGFQKDYCADPENRWEELTSPLRFVFFHPMLPLYIDTRKEGSPARFVRRSCKPNAVLDTFLSEGSEYHFWLVSDRPIAANEQITISWDFRFPIKDKPRMLRLLGLGDDEATGTPLEPDIEYQEYESITNWINLVLAEHGGCACDLGQDCAFVRFHRNYSDASYTRASAPKKKSRKNKTQQPTLSPTSTGQATNSRAASEGHLDDAPEIDGMSQTGSSRSKPPSRDMTPARQGSFDTLGILTEPTDRDKRKVAMVEDSFRRMEQQLPPRKKKRVSDGTGTATSKTKPTSRGSSSQTPNQANGAGERRLLDPGASRSKSNSPLSMASPHLPALHKPGSSRQGSAQPNSRIASVSPRPNYRDAAIQTDAIVGEWYSASTQPKRKFVSLSRRLLRNRHSSQLNGDKQQESTQAATNDTSNAAVKIDPSVLEQQPSMGSLSLGKDSVGPTNTSTSPSLGGSGDIVMADAPLASPTEMKPPPAATLVPTAGSAKHRSPDLRVQTPGAPAFGSPVSATSTGSTPLSAISGVLQSPFSAGSSIAGPFSASAAANGIAANPSPVKKKMSLSDYRSRMNKVQAARPSVGTTMLKPPSANGDEPKSATSVDAPGAADSPTEKPTTDSGASTNGVSAYAGGSNA